MEVCIVRIILKNIGMASEKLYRNTLSTVREVFRGRVGCLESIFSHDVTSWRVLISCLKEKRQAQLGANQEEEKVQCMTSSNEKKIMYAWCSPSLRVV